MIGEITRENTVRDERWVRYGESSGMRIGEITREVTWKSIGECGG